jgi:hypothetical protein
VRESFGNSAELNCSILRYGDYWPGYILYEQRRDWRATQSTSATRFDSPRNFKRAIALLEALGQNVTMNSVQR